MKRLKSYLNQPRTYYKYIELGPYISVLVIGMHNQQAIFLYFTKRTLNFHPQINLYKN